MDGNIYLLQMRSAAYQIFWNKIGEFVPAIDIDYLNDGLVRVNFCLQLENDIAQDDWEISVEPQYKSIFHWAPHLTPDNNYIIDQHAFRCPAVIAHNGEVLTAIMPDLKQMANAQNRWYMDLNAPEEKIILGVSECSTPEHVLFMKKEGNIFKKGNFQFSFFILCSENKEDIENPFKAVLDWHWNQTGEYLFNTTPTTRDKFFRYCEHTYQWAFENWKDTIWQEFLMNGERVGAPVFIVNYTQSKGFPGEASWREPVSVWNQAWFSSLRSASGLFRFAKRMKRSDLLEKAELTKELALSMPKVNGLFYAVAATKMKSRSTSDGIVWESEGWDSLYFGNSNRNPITNDIEASPFHVLDMSFTCLQMLRWYKELEKDERLINYVSDYASTLLKMQRPDGFFPAWVDKSSVSIGILDQSPETSVSITLLAELYEITKNAHYLASAVRAAEAVIHDIIPTGRWEDFETYWSCSRWGEQHAGEKIKRNDMYKQCNFSMFLTAEALYSLFQVTGSKGYLDKGKRVLDEMLMTQAIWQPYFMKVSVFGGFGVMNCDGEWLDARQSLFAEIILKYGIELGLEDYVKRDVAALRASFNMMYCPENPEIKKEWEKRWQFFTSDDYGFTMENYGHEGIIGEKYTGIGEFTIYDWGNGAASEAYMRILDHFDSTISKYE